MTISTYRPTGWWCPECQRHGHKLPLAVRYYWSPAHCVLVCLGCGGEWNFDHRGTTAGNHQRSAIRRGLAQTKHAKPRPGDFGPLNW